MTLTHKDLSAIEAALGPEKAAPIIHCFEKLDHAPEEIKEYQAMKLIMEIANLRTEVAEMRSEVKRLEILIRLPN